MNSRWPRTSCLTAVSAAVVVALASWLSACASSSESGSSVGESADAAVVDTVIIDLRIWQEIEAPHLLWLSARVAADPESDLDMAPLPNYEDTSAYVEASRHTFTEIAIADVGLRIWQRTVEPQRIFVSACAEPCLTSFDDYGAHRTEVIPFRPLGKAGLLLDDGQAEAGRLRYGDLRVAVPRNNPGLLRDREHLLALRDVFDAQPPLNWSVATPTVDWEGVTVSGSPPRVTGLDLSNRNLRGEVWGYLGDLVELRELRLDGNALTGVVPTKLQLLKQLKLIRLGGNELGGCAAPGLWSVKVHDLADTGLEQCPALVAEKRSDLSYVVTQIAWESSGYDDFYYFIVDATRYLIRIKATTEHGATCYLDEGYSHSDPFEAAECGIYRGLGIRRASNLDAYVYWIWETGLERARSHYTGCIYDCQVEESTAAWVERLAASKWMTVGHWDEQTGLGYSEWP